MAMTANGVEANTRLSFKNYEDINIESEVKSEEINDMYAYLNDLPVYLLNFINRRGVTISLLNDNNKAEENYERVYQEPLNSSIQAFCHWENKTIYIESPSNKNYYEMFPNSSEGLSKKQFNKIVLKDNLYHELGHMVDCYWFFTLSQSKEFISIYNEEMNSIRNTNSYKIDNLSIDANINNPNEYFAQAFACYFTHPNELLSNCPKTYSYIDDYMQYLKEKFSSYTKKRKR